MSEIYNDSLERKSQDIVAYSDSLEQRKSRNIQTGEVDIEPKYHLKMQRLPSKISQETKHMRSTSQHRNSYDERAFTVKP